MKLGQLCIPFKWPWTSAPYDIQSDGQRNTHGECCLWLYYNIMDWASQC